MCKLHHTITFWWTVHFDLSATYPKASKALAKLIKTGLDTDEALQSTDDGHRYRYPPPRLLDEQDTPEPSKKNAFNDCSI